MHGFQTNPRGVGGVSHHYVVHKLEPVSDQPSWGRRVERAVWKALVDEFQTNPRGVGGEASSDRLPHRVGFRPTLVGSEVLVVVRLHAHKSSFRPTLVGSEDEFRDSRLRSLPRVSDQPSWGRRFIVLLPPDGSVGFRPTLVGSEDDHVVARRYQLVFQTNPRGVGGERPIFHAKASKAFQTNPRGVGGTSLMI